MFSPAKRTFDLLGPYCRPCNNARQKERRVEKPVTEEQRLRSAAYAKKWREENPRLSKDHKLKSTYGLPIGSYSKMLDQQGGRCAICRSGVVGGKGGDFHLDHCHETNAIRGLLCHGCNVSIGHFHHDPKILQAAIDYLNHYQEKVAV